MRSLLLALLPVLLSVLGEIFLTGNSVTDVEPWVWREVFFWYVVLAVIIFVAGTWGSRVHYNFYKEIIEDVLHPDHDGDEPLQRPEEKKIIVPPSDQPPRGGWSEWRRR